MHSNGTCRAQMLQQECQCKPFFRGVGHWLRQMGRDRKSKRETKRKERRRQRGGGGGFLWLNSMVKVLSWTNILLLSKPDVQTTHFHHKHWLSLCSRFPWLWFSSYVDSQIFSSEMGWVRNAAWCHTNASWNTFHVRSPSFLWIEGKQASFRAIWRERKTRERV